MRDALDYCFNAFQMAPDDGLSFIFYHFLIDNFERPFLIGFPERHKTAFYFGTEPIDIEDAEEYFPKLIEECQFTDEQYLSRTINIENYSHPKTNSPDLNFSYTVPWNNGIPTQNQNGTYEPPVYMPNPPYTVNNPNIPQIPPFMPPVFPLENLQQPQDFLPQNQPNLAPQENTQTQNH